jgi:hypothetical protein
MMPLPHVNMPLHPRENSSQECRRLATYLRTAASRTCRIEFSARMLAVAAELEQQAVVTNSGSPLRSRPL